MFKARLFEAFKWLESFRIMNIMPGFYQTFIKCDIKHFTQTHFKKKSSSKAVRIFFITEMPEIQLLFQNRPHQNYIY